MDNLFCGAMVSLFNCASFYAEYNRQEERTEITLSITTEKEYDIPELIQAIRFVNK